MFPGRSCGSISTVSRTALSMPHGMVSGLWGFLGLGCRVIGFIGFIRFMGLRVLGL